jgi:hypothetical protein
MVELEVEVPAGMVPGERLSVQAPDGTVVDVDVPQGWCAPRLEWSAAYSCGSKLGQLRWPADLTAGAHADHTRPCALPFPLPRSSRAAAELCSAAGEVFTVEVGAILALHHEVTSPLCPCVESARTAH